MNSRLRVLGARDALAVMNFAQRAPLENLFISSRVGAMGVGRDRCHIVGFERNNELVSCLHVANNLVWCGYDAEALDAFVEWLGPRRGVYSIMGTAATTMPLYRALSERWGESWRNARDVRPCQPMMAMAAEPVGERDERIGFITMEHADPYLTASVKMYTEEVGVSPLDGTASYPNYVRSLICAGLALGAIHKGDVWFKSDVGVAWGSMCQIQGVWLDPRLRGHKMSIPAMAQVVHLVREKFPIVSLYVNDYNERARHLYAAVGFKEVATMATVLY